MDALNTAIRTTAPAAPLPVSRRAEDAVLSLASRPGGAEPVLQRKSVEPIFRRPALEPARKRDGSAPVQPAQDAQARAESEAAKAAAKAARANEPPYAWLDLEIVPQGQKPDRRGYSVYARQSSPAPYPAILIDAA